MKEIAAQEASTLVVIVGGGFGQDEFISLTEKGVPNEVFSKNEPLPRTVPDDRRNAPMKIGLLIPCYVDLFYPEVGVAHSGAAGETESECCVPL